MLMELLPPRKDRLRVPSCMRLRGNDAWKELSDVDPWEGLTEAEKMAANLTKPGRLRLREEDVYGTKAGVSTHPWSNIRR